MLFLNISTDFFGRIVFLTFGNSIMNDNKVVTCFDITYSESSLKCTFIRYPILKHSVIYLLFDYNRSEKISLLNRSCNYAR